MSDFRIYKSQKPKTKVWIRVSKKVSKKAVVRNKIRRQIKEVIRAYDIDTDYIIAANPSIRGKDFLDIRNNLLDLLANKHII